MPPPGRGETLVLESLDPDDLDPGVHQPLRALALDKVVGLADADEAAAHARGDEGVRAGREAGGAHGARLEGGVDVRGAQQVVGAGGGRGGGEEGGEGGETSRTATVVLRGATQNHLDDLERAVDDGVGALKALLRDPRLVPGAGASELALARRVDTYGASLRGLAQHAVKRFASALEVVPRTLAENARGAAEGNEVVARLWAKHEKEGGQAWGVDVEVSNPSSDEPPLDSLRG